MNRTVTKRLVLKRLVDDLDLAVAKFKITGNGNPAAAEMERIIARMKEELRK